MSSSGSIKVGLLFGHPDALLPGVLCWSILHISVFPVCFTGVSNILQQNNDMSGERTIHFT